METFSALLALCGGNSPVTDEFPSQRPVTRNFDVFLLCVWINGWVNNREADCDTIVMLLEQMVKGRYKRLSCKHTSKHKITIYKPLYSAPSITSKCHLHYTSWNKAYLILSYSKMIPGWHWKWRCPTTSLTINSLMPSDVYVHQWTKPLLIPLLNQRWLIVDCTHGNKFVWNQKSKYDFLEIAICNIPAILSWTQCIRTICIHQHYAGRYLSTKL